MTKSDWPTRLVLFLLLGACSATTQSTEEPASDAASEASGRSDQGEATRDLGSVDSADAASEASDRSDQGQLDGSVEADGNGPIETAAPDRPERPDAPAACTGPLEDRWGLCPATFDGHPDTFGCRFGASGIVRAAVIDGRQVIEWSRFPTMVQCIYASVNNGAALVGEINIVDSLLFCDRTSYSQAFGSVPDCVPWSCDLVDLCTPSSCTCPLDAGAADASLDAAE